MLFLHVLADDEFSQLCFDYGLELDEVVRERILQLIISKLTYIGLYKLGL